MVSCRNHDHPTASPRGKPASNPKDRPFWLAYTALAVGQATSAVVLAAAPETAATWVAGTPGAPGDAIALKLLASGLGSGAALALALAVRVVVATMCILLFCVNNHRTTGAQEATRMGLGDGDTPERLRLALAAFGATTAALAVVHRAALTASFFANALAAGGVTAALPLLHVARSGGWARAWRAVKGAAGGVRRTLGRLPRQGAVGVVQAALTPVLMGAGAGYLLAAARCVYCPWVYALPCTIVCCVCIKILCVPASLIGRCRRCWVPS